MHGRIVLLVLYNYNPIMVARAFSILQCSYVVDIDVHVPWAPDIEVRLPLTVKPPADEVVSQIHTSTTMSVMLSLL